MSLAQIIALIRPSQASAFEQGYIWATSVRHVGKIALKEDSLSRQQGKVGNCGTRCFALERMHNHRLVFAKLRGTALNCGIPASFLTALSGCCVVCLIEAPKRARHRSYPFRIHRLGRMNCKSEGKTMKKVLFATTALVATAGVAAADVTFGGLGRFGILYNDANASDTSLTTRFRLVVTATAESDNGLSFGAQIRYQADGHQSGSNSIGTGTASNAASTSSTTTISQGAQFNTPRFWVTSGAFTVSVGQVLGAIENMPGMYTGSIGLTGLGYGNVAYNFGADAYTSGGVGSQGIDVIWAGGNWGVHLSHSWDGQGNSIVGAYQGTAFDRGFERTALAVSYVMGNYTFALAGQDSDLAGDTSWAFTASGTWGNFDGSFQIADNDGAMKYGIAGNYQVGSSTFIRGYLNHDEGAALGTGDENIGIGFQHRMGGGTFLEGGVADLAGNTRADLGLRFSF